MDYYLDDENCINRLHAEWLTYKKIIIAYDFDNTIYDYHQTGLQFNDVINLLKDCYNQGAYLIVYTANEDLNFVEKYLVKNNIPFDGINKNAPFVDFENGKLYYNILLDDRSGLRSSYNILKETLMRMKWI